MRARFRSWYMCLSKSLAYVDCGNSFSDYWFICSSLCGQVRTVVTLECRGSGSFMSISLCLTLKSYKGIYNTKNTTLELTIQGWLTLLQFCQLPVVVNAHNYIVNLTPILIITFVYFDWCIGLCNQNKNKTHKKVFITSSLLSWTIPASQSYSCLHLNTFDLAGARNGIYTRNGLSCNRNWARPQ